MSPIFDELQKRREAFATFGTFASSKLSKVATVLLMHTVVVPTTHRWARVSQGAYWWISEVLGDDYELRQWYDNYDAHESPLDVRFSVAGVGARQLTAAL